MSILYYALKGAAIALACWMTAYGGWLSWLHFQSALGPTIAVVAAVGLGIAGHVWRRHIGWALVLGTIGLAAAAVSASVVIDRTVSTQVAGVQVARDKNHPLVVAQTALEDAKAGAKEAAREAKLECDHGRGRRCREAEAREAAARERVEFARTKLAGTGAKVDEDPAAVKMAAVLGTSPERYRTVQSFSPGVLVEIGAPALFAFGLAPVRRAGSDSQRKAPAPLQRPQEDLRHKSRRKPPRKGSAKPKAGTAAYWLDRLDNERPDLAALVRSGTMSANMAAIKAGWRKAPDLRVVS